MPRLESHLHDCSCRLLQPRSFSCSPGFFSFRLDYSICEHCLQNTLVIISHGYVHRRSTHEIEMHIYVFLPFRSCQRKVGLGGGRGIRGGCGRHDTDAPRQREGELKPQVSTVLEGIQENAVPLELEQSALRKLSRDGNSTRSKIESIANSVLRTRGCARWS
jgi:hypothetical protein